MSHQPQTPLPISLYLPISISLQSSSSFASDSLLSSFFSSSRSHFISPSPFATNELISSAAVWLFPNSRDSFTDNNLGSSVSSFFTSFPFHPFVSSFCKSSYSNAASSSDSSEKFSSLSFFSSFFSSSFRIPSFSVSDFFADFSAVSLTSLEIYLPFSFIINGACDYFSSISRPCLSTSFPSGFLLAFWLSLLSCYFMEGLAASRRYCGAWAT